MFSTQVWLTGSQVYILLVPVVEELEEELWEVEEDPPEELEEEEVEEVVVVVGQLSIEKEPVQLKVS